MINHPAFEEVVPGIALYSVMYQATAALCEEKFDGDKDGYYRAVMSGMIAGAVEMTLASVISKAFESVLCVENANDRLALLSFLVQLQISTAQYSAKQMQLICNELDRVLKDIDGNEALSVSKMKDLFVQAWKPPVGTAAVMYDDCKRLVLEKAQRNGISLQEAEASLTESLDNRRRGHDAACG